MKLLFLMQQLVYALLKAQVAVLPFLLFIHHSFRRQSLSLRLLWKLHTGIGYALILLTVLFLLPFLPAPASSGHFVAAPGGVTMDAGAAGDTVPDTAASASGAFTRNKAFSPLAAFVGLLRKAMLPFVYLSLAGLSLFMLKLIRQALEENKLRARASQRFLHAGIPVYCCRNLETAFTSGLPGKNIYLPATLIPGSGEFKAILTHELTHIRQRDTGRLFRESLFLHCFWYSWCAWEIFKNGQRLRELRCDQLAAREFQNGEYLSILWQSACSKIEHSGSPLLSSAWKKRHPKGLLSCRLRLLASGEAPSGKTARFLLPLLLLVTLLLTLGAWQTPLSDQPSTEKTAVEPGGGIQPDQPEPQIKFLWPLPEGIGRISSTYGPRQHPFTGKPNFHRGLDIAWSMGTPVLAVADGKVTETGYLPETSGRYILITHAGGFSSFYAQLQKTLVTPGMKVTAGDTIATLGSSGLSTGPHLHLEIRESEQPKDPELYLP